MQNKITDLLTKKIWLISGRDLPLILRLPLNLVRVLILSGFRFFQNRCMAKSASLTYYTLFSLVPFLALIFGMAKGLGMQQFLESKLRESVARYPAIGEQLIDFSNRMLSNVKGGMIAGIGILLLSSIENTLNNIWGVKKGRSIVRRVTDYTALFLICPVVFLAASSAFIFASAHLNRFLCQFPHGRYLADLLYYTHGVIPLCMVWLVFLIIYMVIPNTKVKLLPALGGSLFAAFIYSVVQSLYVFAQFTMAKFNAVYGSFAAIPLLLFWMNLSWTIVLAGAQLTFSLQNVSEYEMLPMNEKISQQQRYVYSMEIIALLSRAFLNGSGPVSDVRISTEIHLPIRTIRELLRELIACHIVVEAEDSEQPDESHFQVARPPDLLTPSLLISEMEQLGGCVDFNDFDKKYCEVIQTMRNQLTLLPANKPIYELVRENGQK